MAAAVLTMSSIRSLIWVFMALLDCCISVPPRITFVVSMKKETSRIAFVRRLIFFAVMAYFLSYGLSIPLRVPAKPQAEQVLYCLPFFPLRLFSYISLSARRTVSLTEWSISGSYTAMPSAMCTSSHLFSADTQISSCF